MTVGQGWDGRDMQAETKRAGRQRWQSRHEGAKTRVHKQGDKETRGRDED